MHPNQTSMRIAIHIVLQASLFLATLVGGQAFAACDVFGPIADDAINDDERVGVVQFPGLDIDHVQNCYDSAADQYEFRLAVRDASSLPAWGEWLVLLAMNKYSAHYAVALTGPGGTLAGYRLVIRSNDANGNSAMRCGPWVGGYLHGNTIVITAPRHTVDLYLGEYSASFVLEQATGITGLTPAPRVIETVLPKSCDWPWRIVDGATYSPP